MFKNLFFLIFSLIYFGMGIFQLVAVAHGIIDWWGWNKWLAYLIATPIAYIPVLGTVVGIMGAIKSFGWSPFQAISLFCWPYLLMIAFWVLTYFASSFFLVFSFYKWPFWVKLPEWGRWVLFFPLVIIICAPIQMIGTTAFLICKQFFPIYISDYIETFINAVLCVPFFTYLVFKAAPRKPTIVLSVYFIFVFLMIVLSYWTLTNYSYDLDKVHSTTNDLIQAVIWFFEGLLCLFLFRRNTQSRVAPPVQGEIL